MAKEKSFVEELKAAEEEVNKKKAAEKEVIDEATENKKEDVAKKEMETYELLEKETGLTKAEVDAWKENYFNKVFVFRIDDTETYVYRYLARPEWKKIISSFNESTLTEELLNEQIFNKCVLYPTPSPELRQRLGAGTIDSIAYAIRLSSNFLPEEIIARNIVKL